MGISSAENCDLFWKTVVFTDKNRDSGSKMGMHPLGQTWQFTSRGNWELFLLPLHGLFLELPGWTTDNVTIHADLAVCGFQSLGIRYGAWIGLMFCSISKPCI